MIGYYDNTTYKEQVVLQYMNISEVSIAGEAANITANYWTTETDRREGKAPLHTENYYIRGELFEKYYQGVGSGVYEHWKDRHYEALSELEPYLEADPAI